MKKLLIVLSVLLVVSFIYADRTSAHKGVTDVVAISDPLQKNLAKVDSDNNLQTGKIFHTGVSKKDGVVNTDGSACVVYGIYFESSTAGDYVEVWDGGHQSGSGDWGTFMFEVSVGVAHTPTYIPFPGGMEFTKECYLEFEETAGSVYYATVMYNETD